jgi:voltage-gated potassium channel
MKTAPVRAPWWLGPSGIALSLVVGAVAAGTAGYVLVEGWSVWDAFYMTVITVTTVGYREVHPLTRAGEALTVVLLFGGVGTFFYVLSLFVAGVVQAGFAARWESNRRDRMLDELRDHFIVCGYGKMGRIIVDEFRRQDVPFVVVDRDPELAHELIAAGSLAVAGDAGAEEVLRRIGIDRSRGLISAVGSDAENVYIILSARLTRPDLFIIGRAENGDAIAKLRRAGADRVFSPYQAGAHQMAQAALRPAVVDFVQLATSSERLELGIEQIRLTAASPLCGQSLAAANVRQRFGVVVVGIQRAGGKMEFNPAPETQMAAGDDLIVMGRPDTLKQLEGAAAGARPAGTLG